MKAIKSRGIFFWFLSSLSLSPFQAVVVTKCKEDATLFVYSGVGLSARPEQRAGGDHPKNTGAVPVSPSLFSVGLKGSRL